MLRPTFLPAVLFLVAALPAPASAQWAYWNPANGGNGHIYRVFRAPAAISWNDARVAAEAAGGHLATVTSAAENDFVFGVVDRADVWVNGVSNGYSFGPWIGGYQVAGPGGPAANWRWVTDEPWGYTRWLPGEPNDFDGGNETRLHYYSPGYNTRGARWNDLYGGSYAYPVAYVVEIDAPPAVAVESVVVNRGDPQRSMVGVIQVTFSGPAAARPGAFHLTRTGLPGGQPGDGATIAGGGDGQILTAFNDVNGKTVARLTFASRLPAVRAGSLAGGVWRLDVRAGGVLGLAADHSTPTTAGAAGRIFRLFGDLDGNGVVDGLDAGPFDNALFTLAGDPGYLAAADWDGNGRVDGLDAGSFDGNLFTGID